MGKKTDKDRLVSGLRQALGRSNDADALSEIELQDMIDKAERVAHRATQLVQSGQQSFVVCPRRPGESGYVIRYRDGRQEVVA